MAEARRIAGPAALVGLSTHSPEQFDAALAAEGAARPDQVSAGPVWETPTKEGRPAAGLELIRHAATTAPDEPWFAIGGIDAANVGEVVAAGARRIVVVRAIRDAADPEAAARELRRRSTSLPADGEPGAKAHRAGSSARSARPSVASAGAAARGDGGPQRGRNEAAREALEPLAAGRATHGGHVGAVISALIAISSIVGYAAGVEVTKVGSDGIEQGTDRAPIVSVIAVVALMGTMAWGMWRARYWAVLGFQALLVLVLVAASLGLLQATEWLQAVGTAILIAGRARSSTS